MIKMQYVCDICGEVKDKSSDVMRVEIEHEGDKMVTDQFDMCAACRKNLLALIRNMKKK